jgi:integral membrane sensor domain MASE1
MLKIPYVILSFAAIAFACPFALYGYTLFTATSDQWGPIGVGIAAFYMVSFLIVFGLLSPCGLGIEMISPFKFTNSSILMRMATLLYYECITVVIIQLMSLVIANPILGRPVAFTPRGDTFGIMLGLLIGLGIVTFIVYLIIRGIRYYAKKHWIKETTDIVDREQNVV